MTKFLVWDFGMSVEHAVALAEGGKNLVRYYTPWARGYPAFSDYAPGLGMEHIEKVLYFFDHVDWADVIVFFDVGAGDIASFLKKKGYTVYGGGRIGEELEQNRWMTRKLQKEIGLPVQDTVKIHGVANLRKYLEKNPKKFVKLDIFRGDAESFFSKNYDFVKIYLDEIEAKLGPFHENYQFLVENVVEGVEPGWDLLFNGNKWLTPYLYGYEFEKGAYIGRFTNRLPDPLNLVAEKLQPVLQKLDYRGAMSVETMIDKKGNPFLIDICSRFPYPLSLGYPTAIKNFPEVITAIAKKQDINLKITNKYFGVLPLSSDQAQNSWVKLDFPKSMRDKIKGQIVSRYEGEYYAVKGNKVIFCLVAVGNTVQEVADDLKQTVKKVDARGMMTEVVGALDKIGDIIEKGKKFGVDF